VIGSLSPAATPIGTSISGSTGATAFGTRPQKVLGVLPTLAELLALVGVPGTRLLHDAKIDGDIEDRTFPADALAVHDVELRSPKRRGALVLHDLHPGAVADHLGAVLDRLDAADLEADRRVELERTAPWCDLRRAVDHADLLSQLVDEDAIVFDLLSVPVSLRSAWDMRRACRPTWLSPISPSISARGVSARPSRSRRRRCARADQHVGDLESLLTRVGLGDQQLVDVDADRLGVDGSIACSASM
jgi:hypothetical protein